MRDDTHPQHNPADEAARILVERRLDGSQGERLPESCRPKDLTDALAIQAAVTRLWCEQADDSIGGWKCLLPPTDKLVVGPIYTRSIDTVPPVSLWAPGGVARIEPELVFILGQDLPPRDQVYTPAEVDAAIARTHLGLELIHGRYADPASATFPEMLADGLVNQGLFIGPEVDGELARQADAFDISLALDGEDPRVVKGAHPNQAPRAPIYWLVEFLRQQGQGLEAGQAIITGSYAGVLEVPVNRELTLDYGNLGSLHVQFTQR